MGLGSDPGFGKNLFRTPDPGVKKAPDHGSGSATLVYASMYARMYACMYRYIYVTRELCFIGSYVQYGTLIIELTRRTRVKDWRGRHCVFSRFLSIHTIINLFPNDCKILTVNIIRIKAIYMVRT
jgi:hypothetical protein